MGQINCDSLISIENEATSEKKEKKKIYQVTFRWTYIECNPSCISYALRENNDYNSVVRTARKLNNICYCALAVIIQLYESLAELN